MKKFIPWMAAAAIIVVTFGTMYGAVQQSQRNDGDMPQVQMAQDMASALNDGVMPNVAMTRNVEASDSVNIETSLDPFTIIYSKSGEPIASSGYIKSNIPEDTMPKVPFGVLKAADNKPYHRVTWQPENGVRIAAVAVAANNYYVLSGRSMKLLEQNELRTFQVAAFGCAVSLGILAVAFAATQSLTRKK